MQFGTSGENTVSTPEAATANMVVSLKKGEKVNLSKVTDSLEDIMVGLGWDVAEETGVAFDLDASVFMCDANNRCSNALNFIYYRNPQDPAGCCVHQGDNRTGAGDGDDEQILIHFKKVPSNVEKMAVTVTIYDADVNEQNFGMVKNAYVRLVDNKTGRELLRFPLTQDFSLETAIVFAELYKHNGEWKFHAVGEGFNGGLAALVRNYGLEVL